jgi:hypothetical protein
LSASNKCKPQWNNHRIFGKVIIMNKIKYSLAGPPNITVHYVHPWQVKSQSIFNPHALKYVMLGVFGLGVLLGGGMVASDKISQADQLGRSNGQVASAVTTQQWSKPLDFSFEDLNVVTDFLPILIEESRHQPTAEELANQQRRERLREYFLYRNSPFAKDNSTIDAFLNSNNMKLMIAISFVESTMGKRCYYHNCSGIGGYPPNLRKYESYAEWVRDFDLLLERRYKGMDPEDMMGVYVQPGSPNWISGVRQILAELEEQGIE